MKIASKSPLIEKVCSPYPLPLPPGNGDGYGKRPEALKLGDERGDEIAVVREDGSLVVAEL